MNFVILSEAKDLLSSRSPGKQILRFAQDDNDRETNVWSAELHSAWTAEGGCPYATYSPPTVRPSMRMVGEATLPRNSRSVPISEMLQKMSLRLPATVISSTG
jgi:hypothetical protein